MDIFSFLVIISGATNLFLGYLVLTRGAKNRVTFTLSSCAILSGIWAILLYLYHFHIIFSSFFWIKAVYFLVFIVVFNLFYFSLIFPFQRWKSIFFPIFLYWIISIPLFYTLFFTKLWIKDVVYKWWGPETILGPAYIPVSVFWGFFGIWTLYNFFREYLISTGINREKVKYVFLGMCLFILIVMTVDGIIPLLTGNTQYFRISPLSSLFFVAFTAYAITRHKLLDIRIPIAGTFVGLILIILIFNIFAVGTKTGIISLSVSFILIAILGYFLIRTISQEIRTREEAYEELKKIDVAKS